jgi:hypothetical protein
MKLIESKTLATAAASIEFTSIPQTYTDLVLVASLRNAGGNEVFVRFNGDTGGNYSWRRLQGTGAAALSDSQASYGGYNAFFYFTYASTENSDTANTFGNGQLYIPNYTGSTTKSVSSDAVNENNATTARQAITAGLWNNTSAITSIAITGNGNYAIGSTVSLYGILKGSDGIVTTS